MSRSCRELIDRETDAPFVYLTWPLNGYSLSLSNIYNPARLQVYECSSRTAIMHFALDL